MLSMNLYVVVSNCFSVLFGMARRVPVNKNRGRMYGKCSAITLTTALADMVAMVNLTTYSVALFIDSISNPEIISLETMLHSET